MRGGRRTAKSDRSKPALPNAWENGNLHFLLGVVRILSKFGEGCIFFQHLVTNYMFYGSRKGWLYFLVIFFEFLVFVMHFGRVL